MERYLSSSIPRVVTLDCYCQSFHCNILKIIFFFIKKSYLFKNSLLSHLFFFDDINKQDDETVLYEFISLDVFGDTRCTPKLIEYLNTCLLQH